MRPGPDPLADPRAVRRLLVRAPNWLGDTVLSLPALAALRRRFPRATLTVAARPGPAEILRGHPDVDEILTDPRRAGARSPLPLLGHARRLRRERFDAAVVLARSFASALAVRAAGVPVRAGLATDRRRALLTHPVEETGEHRTRRHHAEVYLEVAGALGAEGPADVPRLPVDAEAEEAADRILDAAGLASGAPFVAIHPGASRAERTWPAARFGEAARRLAGDRDGRVLVLGTADEAALCAEAAAAAGDRAVDLAGLVALRPMVALHRRAGLVIGNDSGAMHVAAAAGAPVVGLFGPGDPRKTSPLADAGRFEAVTLDFPCSPCRQRFFRECKPATSGRPSCLHDIDVDRVLAAAGRVLSGRPVEWPGAAGLTTAGGGEPDAGGAGPTGP